MSTQPQQFSHFPHIPPPVGVRLSVLPAHRCSYLPGRETVLRAFAAPRIAPTVYHDFMDAGFRRSGPMVYQPVCIGCRECRPIRVRVSTFAPTKSQRRAVKRNPDVTVTIAKPVLTEEKFELFARYCDRWHEHAEPETPDGLRSFLYDSPVNSIEFEYRVGERLVGVGICDACEGRSLSSVYFYFDPDDATRSLGTFSALREIEFARENDLPFYYLGFWISACDAMRYKSKFGPAETLDLDGIWRPLTGDDYAFK